MLALCWAGHLSSIPLFPLCPSWSDSLCPIYFFSPLFSSSLYSGRMALGWGLAGRNAGCRIEIGVGGGIERINNQDLRKLLGILLFLISTLPLIYAFLFLGPSDGPPLLCESPVSTLQHFKSLKNTLYPLTMFPRGESARPVVMETVHPA